MIVVLKHETELNFMQTSIFVFFNQILMLGYMMVGSLAFVFWLIPTHLRMSLFLSVSTT